MSTDNFNVFLREAYVEMKNVIKSAPEVTFWAGQRFYDRYNIDSQDYFFLDTSGFGGGAYNIPLGPGSLAIAYLGAIEAAPATFGATMSASTISPSMLMEVRVTSTGTYLMSAGVMSTSSRAS